MRGHARDHARPSARGLLGPSHVARGVARELRLAAAVHWYGCGRISEEQAAEIAGVDRTDFLLALARYGQDVFQVDFDDLKRELECD